MDNPSKSWTIQERGPPLRPLISRTFNNPAFLSQRSELAVRCRHRRKHLLAPLDDGTWPTSLCGERGGVPVSWCHWECAGNLSYGSAHDRRAWQMYKTKTAGKQQLQSQNQEAYQGGSPPKRSVASHATVINLLVIMRPPREGCNLSRDRLCFLDLY